MFVTDADGKRVETVTDCKLGMTVRLPDGRVEKIRGLSGKPAWVKSGSLCCVNHIPERFENTFSQERFREYIR